MRVLSSLPASVRAALAGIVVALAAVLTVANPAAAHDELVGSSPAPGADLAEAPRNLPLHAADAVLSSALCDLVSARWVESMAAAIGQDHGVDVAVTDIESSIIKGSGTMLAGGKRISIEPYLERVKKDIVPDVVGTVIAKVRQMGRSPDRVVLVGGGAPFYSGKVAEMYGADIVRTLEDPVSANARGFYFYGCQQVSEG